MGEQNEIAVFISYCHESEAHRERVRRLADTLASENVSVHLD